MPSAPQPITYADRVIIILAVRSGCSVSAEMEQRLRGLERARVVECLRNLAGRGGDLAATFTPASSYTALSPRC